MRVTFSIRSKNLGISEIRSVDFLYDDFGYICSLTLYGTLEKLGIALSSKDPTDFPLDYYLYVLDISWSKYKGFEFKQYIDSSLSSSLTATFGSLQGHTQIQISGNLISLVFRAEVDASDLGKTDERLFLDNANRYGITVKGIVFSNTSYLSGLNLSHCNFIDVSFLSCTLENVKFISCRLTNVKFTGSIVNDSDFEKSILNNVEFENSSLIRCNFQKCEVKYSVRKIWDEAILRIYNCKLQYSNFKHSQICLIAKNSDLTEADFSQAELVACRFYGCNLRRVNFTGSKFTSSAEADKLREQYSDPEKFICKFGHGIASSNDLEKGEIYDSTFVGALMTRIDFSHNHIVNCNFEDADLRNASLHHCEIRSCSFQRVTLSSAKCGFTNFSFSHLYKNNFSEVDFYKAVMVSIEDKGSNFASSKLAKANLKDSKFIGSILTGVFFGDANLTLASFDRCKLNGSNFHQTQRSGIDFNISDQTGRIITSVADLQNTNDGKQGNKALPKLVSTCEIGNVQWYSNSNGEILIDENTFLHIIIGNKSPIAVLANLTKDNPSIISIMNQNQASADSRSAGHDQVNADTNIDSVANSSVNAPDIRIGKDLDDDTEEDNDLSTESKDQPIPDDIVSNDPGDDDF